jgi:predicted nucleic acid-binding protein
MLVVDANIAIKFVTLEPGREEAYDRTDGEAALIAPDWILIETGHALWRKARMGLLNREAAERCLEQLPFFFVDLVGAKPLAGAAQKLAFELDHWIYDCFYLALALDRDAPLLTADRKFWNAAKRAGYGGSVELLEWDDQAL